MIKCLMCNSTEIEILGNKYAYGTSEFRRLFPKMRIAVCKCCGLHQVLISNTSENNSNLTMYYEKYYRTWSKRPSLTNRHNILWVRGKSIANLLKEKINKTDIQIFEKGSGLGFNLYHIKELFPKAKLYTDEMDQHSRNNLEKIGVKIQSIDDADQKYDVIIISHVLEHLLDPIETIQKAYDNLNENGILYIEVPNNLKYEEPHITFWEKESFEYMIEHFFLTKLYIDEVNITGLTCRFPNTILGKCHCFVVRFINHFWQYKFYNYRNENGDTLKVLLHKAK